MIVSLWVDGNIKAWRRKKLESRRNAGRADGSYRRVKPGKRHFNLHQYFMTNPSLSGRGHALEGKAIPKLSLSQRGAS